MFNSCHRFGTGLCRLDVCPLLNGDHQLICSGAISCKRLRAIQGSIYLWRDPIYSFFHFLCLQPLPFWLKPLYCRKDWTLQCEQACKYLDHCKPRGLEGWGDPSKDMAIQLIFIQLDFFSVSYAKKSIILKNTLSLFFFHLSYNVLSSHQRKGKGDLWGKQNHSAFGFILFFKNQFVFLVEK